MAMVSANGKTELNTKVCGVVVSKRVKVASATRMAQFSLEILQQITLMAKVKRILLTVVFSLATSSMVNSTAKASTSKSLMLKSTTVYGSKMKLRVKASKKSTMARSRLEEFSKMELYAARASKNGGIKKTASFTEVT